MKETFRPVSGTICRTESFLGSQWTVRWVEGWWMVGMPMLNWDRQE